MPWDSATTLLIISASREVSSSSARLYEASITQRYTLATRLCRGYAYLVSACGSDSVDWTTRTKSAECRSHLQAHAPHRPLIRAVAWTKRPAGIGAYNGLLRGHLHKKQKFK